ncbi:hypothetical protein ES703_92635 [subsurface metagenome]
MPEFEVTISSTFTLEFNDDPTEEDVIDFCRQDPASLLSEIEVDSINEV